MSHWKQETSKELHKEYLCACANSFPIRRDEDLTVSQIYIFQSNKTVYVRLTPNPQRYLPYPIFSNVFNWGND